MFGISSFKTLAAAAFLAAAGFSGAASAATVSATCPDSGTWDRYFDVTSDDPDVTSVSCYAWGENNNKNDQAFLDQIAADGYVDVGADNGTGNNDGFDDMTSLVGGTGGDFSTTGAVDAIVVFKVGNGNCKDSTVPDENLCVPAYAAFNITTTGEALLSWSTTMQQGLSHVSIYVKTAAVPVPAAGILLLGGLGALGLAKRRRRQA